MQDLDMIQQAARAARGRRPEFTGDPMVERLFGITLALTAELAVTRERLDTVERLLSQRSLVERDAIESFHPDPTEARERGALQQDYLARVFRILLQDEPGVPVALVGDPRAAPQDDAHGIHVA